jgi:hypothetical protein
VKYVVTLRFIRLKARCLILVYKFNLFLLFKKHRFLSPIITLVGFFLLLDKYSVWKSRFDTHLLYPAFIFLRMWRLRSIVLRKFPIPSKSSLKETRDYIKLEDIIFWSEKFREHLNSPAYINSYAVLPLRGSTCDSIKKIITFQSLTGWTLCRNLSSWQRFCHQHDCDAMTICYKLSVVDIYFSGRRVVTLPQKENDLTGIMTTPLLSFQ